VDDLNKLGPARLLLAAGGLVLFIASFLEWFSVDTGGILGSSFSLTANGWDVGFLWGGLPALLGLALAVLILLPVFAKDLKLPAEVPWLLIYAIAGIVAGALVILKLLIGESDPWDRSYGLYLAAIAGIATLIGGILLFTSGEAKMPSGGGAGGGSTPPSPPSA